MSCQANLTAPLLVPLAAATLYAKDNDVVDIADNYA